MPTTDASNPRNSNQQPLAVIRDKERALAQIIQHAREKARARITETQARATSIITQAERDGIQEAEHLYREGIAQSQAQAAQIGASGESAAKQLRENGVARIAQAAEYIVRFVLPGEEN